MTTFLVYTRRNRYYLGAIVARTFSEAVKMAEERFELKDSQMDIRMCM